jgi:predicted ester cyclase
MWPPEANGRRVVRRKQTLRRRAMSRAGETRRCSPGHASCWDPRQGTEKALFRVSPFPLRPHPSKELTIERLTCLTLATTLLSCAAHAGPATTLPTTPSESSALPTPRQIFFDDSFSQGRADNAVLAARRLYAFWDSGNTAFLDEAIAPTFVDRTLPPGRPQGPEGPAFASQNFRAAVPDLRCEVEQLIVSGDRVVAHLRFRGHFTGRFGDRNGGGEPVNFIATDILRVVDGRVTDNWHIEDNLTLLQQLGVVKS